MGKNTKKIDSKTINSKYYELVKWVEDNTYVIYAADARQRKEGDIFSYREVEKFEDELKAKEYFNNIK